VRGAEFINTKLREQYWVRFSKQNYFDERGVFAVVMFTGPLICLALVQLVRRGHPHKHEMNEPFHLWLKVAYSLQTRMFSLQYFIKWLICYGVETQGILVGGPPPRRLSNGVLLCLQFIFLFATADMLVQVKKAELREKHKEKKKQQ
jgi:hypothetical protein